MTESTNQETFNNCPYCGKELPQGEFFCSAGNCASPAIAETKKETKIEEKKDSKNIVLAESSKQSPIVKKEKPKKSKPTKNKSKVAKGKKVWLDHAVHKYIKQAKAAPNSFVRSMFFLIILATFISMLLHKVAIEIIFVLLFLAGIFLVELISNLFFWILPKDNDLDWDKYVSWLYDETTSIVVAIDISVTSNKKKPYYVTVSLADDKKNAVHKGVHVIYSNFNYGKHYAEIFGTNLKSPKSKPIKRVARCYWEQKYDPKTMVIELEDLVLFCRQRDDL